MRTRMPLLAIAIGLMPFVASNTRADLIVDTFAFPTPAAQVSGPAPAVFIGPSTDASIFGTRTLSTSSALFFGDGVGIGTSASPPFPGSTLQSFSGANTFVTRLNYAFPSAQDFNGQALALDYLFFNNGSLGPTDITMTLATSTGPLTDTVNFPNSFPATFLVPFGGFTGPGNLSNVTGLTIDWNTNNSLGVDFVLDGIRVVPEPSTLAVWTFFGLGGLWVVRRRRQARKPAAC